MQKFKAFFEETKNQPDVWIFYIFLLVFPLTIRKVIFFYPLGSESTKTFNEYSGIYSYLSDIFILLLMITWTASTLYNKNSTLSNINKLSPQKLWITCVKQAKKVNFKKTKSFLKKCSTWNIWKDYLFLAPSLLVIWSFISIFWSENQSIAFFRSIKLLEFFLLYLFIRNKLLYFNQNVPRPPRLAKTIACRREAGGTFTKTNKEQIKKNVLRILIFWGIIQSIIAIWQFFIQKSLGLKFLQESIINPETLGVAKIIVENEKYIRAYGLFPHPNILGGFLLLTIISTYLYKKMFHVEHFKIKKCFFRSLLIKKIRKIVKNVPRGTFLINLLLLVQIAALLLTFSKSAIIGLVIAIIYIFIQNNRLINVPRGTLFHVEHFFGVEQLKRLKHYFFLSFVIFGILLFYFKIDFYSLFIKSLEERFIYLTTSIQAISQNLLWGLGQGQFVLEMSKYSLQNLAFWQFQPVHNVFLLILSELGMIGLFFFIWFLLEIFNPKNKINCSTSVGMFHVEHCSTWNILRGKRGTINEITMKQSKNCHSVPHLESESLDNKNQVPNQSQIKNYTWNIHLKSILLGFIFIMLFDHYLWDIQQGSLMLWIVLGLISAKR